MGWVYHQSTGELYYNGEKVGKGYAGRMTNKNNPDRQQVKGLGPLPRGKYLIKGTTHSKGPLTIVLEQKTGETFGRNNFRIHGERKKEPAGWASEGCIIMGQEVRKRVAKSIVDYLEVVR